jgi:transcriptional regulator with XRE-family HTH domain
VQALAGLIGITIDEVERIEEGSGSPSIDTVWRWCRACERIPSDLLREAEHRANIRNWD